MNASVTLEQIASVALDAQAAGVKILARVVRANWLIVDQACRMYTVHRVGAQFKQAGYGCSDSSFRHLVARLRREVGDATPATDQNFVSHDTKQTGPMYGTKKIDQPVIAGAPSASSSVGAVIGGVSNAQMLSDARAAAKEFKRKRQPA